MTPARPWRRARHLGAAGVTVLAMAVDDPAWLTVQAGRRAPRRLRGLLGRLATRTDSSSPTAVWGELLLDRPEQARERLSRQRRSGALSRALAVHAGQRPDQVGPGGARARWAWLVGDLEEVEMLLADDDVPRRLREKLAGDLEALQPGPRPAPAVPPRDWRTDPTRPRVVHALTNSLPWTRSGYTLRSHAVLHAQQQAGIEVAALTRPAYPVSIGRVLTADVDVVEGVPYHRCVPTVLAPGEAGRIDRWAADLARLARAHRATHLHSTTHYPNALAAQAAARALDLPWVHEVRGQLERTWASARRRAGDPAPYASSRFVAWRAREAELAAAADHVVTISETMRADLVERGVEPGRVSVVPNGIDASLLQCDITPERARGVLGLAGAGLWVGAVSSVVHYEGLTDLVEAVALLRAQGVDVRGVVVGDGVAWPGLSRRVAELGLEETFLLPGRLDRDDALRWLDALDVVVVPREDHEVTRLVPPLKLVEAMGVGRPVVASDLPPMAEIVAPGETGLLTPPQDPTALATAVGSLLEDSDRRHDLAARARAFAAGRTWGALTGTYRDVYARSGGSGPAWRMES
ncbi:glycosyltransferase family 4 protein [uncultured Serinicoccus sp.]|uniref:glycosyltransferase family 4 protein n=1 Tax=uncultured Serinicoccus sp. TaxID=735514 RepID=UPI002604ED0E|nr:glycosyltransferase [uncultured Serinicoccus sp.]